MIVPSLDLDFLTKAFGFVDEIFWIGRQNLLNLSEKYANDTIQWPHRYMGHTAWAPEGREGRSQRGPKGRKLEVGARRAPKLLVVDIVVDVVDIVNIVDVVVDHLLLGFAHFKSAPTPLTQSAELKS